MSELKARVFAAWTSELRSRRDALHAEQGAARGGTRVDGSHRPANRGERAAVTSQGYLAAGLAQRLGELDVALDLLERLPLDPRPRVALGALVQLEDEEGEPAWIALLPGGDASALYVDEQLITVLSASAPLARALIGLEPGDSAEHPARRVELELLQVG